MGGGCFAGVGCGHDFGRVGGGEVGVELDLGMIVDGDWEGVGRGFVIH